MDINYVILLFVIGFISSFLSGMLGIGGAIVKYPMLLMIPPALGFHALTAHEVSGISALDVLFVSIAGVIGYRSGGYLNKSLITIMGMSVLIGTFIGSFGSQYLTEAQVNIVYGILALVAAVMMFIPKKELDDIPLDQVTFNKPIAAILAFFVGIGSGVVGAGGGFLLIPIMLSILHIPARMAIASSLAITFISSLAGSIGKISTGQIDYPTAVIIIIAGIIAAPLGAKISQKMNTKVLQNILAVLILGTAIKIWIDIF
ncbi:MULTISPECIES: sulfite exporter TauE/SafE family protein [Lysinibacillus]|uniref:Probable membrane transporter protein n=1 Tax=Lysinibacillus antri TaxID=2498145 RepID=A0A432L7Y8_9BACI|nr:MULTISPECIES: sulfite exporter TauE/SafE family protein [Lysinibacillus]RUL48620.1 sulfite exporter TauE/SafE family protein [Lysinibacillus antri]TSI09712.1 sulfite exporter TauE/SafE family protein [Lysinibacillus sp. BW-2-10]